VARSFAEPQRPFAIGKSRNPEVTPPQVAGGPTLGIELNDAALARLRLREVVTEPPIGRDGSVQDW
jgi:hypothetical protein